MPWSRGRGGQAFPIQADISSVGAIRTLFEAFDAELARRKHPPGLDILVNNAGIRTGGTVASTNETDFDRLLATHLKGSFFVTQHAMPRLHDGGRVITLSSGLSRRPTSDTVVYSMAKAALNTFTEALAAELGPRGATANALAPGWTATDINRDYLGDPGNAARITAKTALGRIGRTEDIAAVAAFLAGPDSGWVTGQYIEASGGFGLGQ